MNIMSLPSRSSMRRKQPALYTSNENKRKVTKSIHPSPSPDAIDATSLNLDDIVTAISQKSSLVIRLDFVNVSDADIESIFVTQFVRSKKNLLFFPPKACRRTAKQIREF